MEIILKEDIVGLGYKNDIVNVKPGYGRNYLIPTGKGVLASPSARKMLAEELNQERSAGCGRQVGWRVADHPHEGERHGFYLWLSEQFADFRRTEEARLRNRPQDDCSEGCERGWLLSGYNQTAQGGFRRGAL